MSEKLTLNRDHTPLQLEGHDQYYSSYWIAEVPLQDILDLCDGLGASSDDEAILYTESEPANKMYSYEDAKKEVANDTPRFFRLNTLEYDLTWEDTGDYNIIGFMSVEEEPNRLQKAYEDTSGLELGEEDLTIINEFTQSYGF